LFEDFTLNPFRLPLRRPTFDLEPFWQADSWVAQPAIDLVERDNAYELAAEMPGLNEKNIEVDVANGELTVKGQREEEKVEKKQDFQLRERRFGSFSRSVCIPETVDADKIEATFKNGVLKVTLPKKPEAQRSVKKNRGEGRLRPTSGSDTRRPLALARQLSSEQPHLLLTDEERALVVLPTLLSREKERVATAWKAFRQMVQAAGQ
jgi:HSP20 family protein